MDWQIGVLVWTIIVALVIALIWMIVFAKKTERGSVPGSLTAFHDFSPRDKQNAIEIIMEEKAGRLSKDKKATPAGTKDTKDELQ